MRRFLGLAVTLLAAGSAWAQIDREKNEVQVVAYWETGETETYQVTSTKVEIRDEQESVLQSSSYFVDIEITDTRDDGYTIEWTYHDVDLPEGNPTARALAAAFEGFTVVVETDEFGEFLSVVNWKEMSDKMSATIDTLVAAAKGDAALKTLAGNLKASFSTKKAIESLAVKEIQQFYTFHGGLYEINQEYTGESQVDNPLGTRPLDVEVSVSVDEEEVYEDSFVVRMWSTSDPVQASETIRSILNRGLQGTGKPLVTEDQLGDFLIEDRTASEIHGPSGWVLTSLQVREVTYQGVRRLDKRIIELVEE